MKRVVMVILDGLRRDFVDAARTPHLAEFAPRAERFPAYRYRLSVGHPGSDRDLRHRLPSGAPHTARQLDGAA